MFSIAYLAFALFTLLLLGFVGYGTYRTAKILPDWPQDQNPLLHPAETALRILMIFVCIGLGLLSGQSFSTLGWQTSQPLAQIAWGTLWGLLIAVVYIISTRWIIAASGGRYYTPTVVRVIIPRNNQQLASIALVMVSIVILEELLFRSLLLGGFAPLLPSWLLLTIAAIIFGLMHSPQGWWGMIAIAIAGVVLGLMFLGQQSLLMPAVAHYVANMVQIAYAYWFGIPEVANAQ